MIIECPSCHTKFSVDDSHVADIDDPRFHCCRCGNYFRPNEAKEAAEAEQTATEDVAPQEVIESNDWQPEIEAAELEGFDEQTDAQVEQLDLIPTEPEDNSLLFPEANVEKNPGAEREPLITADWLDHESTVSQREEVDYSGAIPHSGETHSGKTGSGETGSSGKVAKLIAQARRREDVEREAAFQKTGVQKPKTPTPQSITTLNNDTLRSSQAAAETKESSAPTPKIRERERRSAKRRASRHQRWITEMELENQSSAVKRSRPKPVYPFYSPNRAPVLFICVIPLLVVLALTFSAAHIQKLPEIIISSLHLDTRHIPKIPPKGLNLVGLSSTVVTLDNGKRVLEVRGEILNGTQRSFKQFTIEASLFDVDNRQLIALNVNPRNELQEAKLRALDPETIQTLQKRPLVEKNSLAPNSRSPFRLVFPVVEGKEKWFSARVYTVFPA